MTNVSAGAARWQPSLVFLAFSAIPAGIAASAAFTSLHLGFAPWAMFIGWVAYFTRPVSGLQGLRTWFCLLGGILAGAASVLGLDTLAPVVGSLALPLIVFVVAMVVVSMRAVRSLDNILAWFLGMIAFFAAHV